MPFIDYKSKNKVKIWEGIYGQVHHSNGMTQGHLSIGKGVDLPEHHHIHEQWSHLLEGEMEFIVGGEKKTHEAWRNSFHPIKRTPLRQNDYRLQAD